MDQEKRDKIKVGSLITATVLAELYACSTEVAEFEQFWPHGLALRLKNLKKVAEAGFDVWWFAAEVLSEEGQWSEYHKFKKLQNEILERDMFDEDDDEDDQIATALALWEIIKQRK